MPIPKKGTAIPNKNKAKKPDDTGSGLKQLSLLDYGFTKPSSIKSNNQLTEHKQELDAPVTKPFQHSPAELPKIRKQNMANYADLSQYTRADDTRLDTEFPMLAKIVADECQKIGPAMGITYQTEQRTKIRNFYAIIREDTSRILIHKFIRPVPKHTMEYYYRLAQEFWLIKKKTFTKVFLQVLDILELIDPTVTPHVIRGSAGSCLVCYLLGITDSDPIEEDISLARFMHAARDDLPDIDMDFPHNQREAIYAKIFAMWPERVARISNHVSYGAKTALKQVMREHGAKGVIPKDFALEDYFSDPVEQEEIRTAAEELEGQFKHFSLHCGGIVIFDQPIPAEYYLQDISAKSGEDGQEVAGVQINLNKDQVDDYAFIKIDVLSNRGLSQLWDIANMPILEYPANDPKTLAALSAGRNIGLTYAESRAIGKTLQHIQPTSVHDIATALAIIRPAASGNGQKMDFLRDLSHLRTVPSQNSESRDYIIYDDDAIQIIERLLGCGESKADVYRKAFAKRKYRLIKEFSDLLDFRYPNWPASKREAICDQLTCLQDYSFCKSHALSYAKLVYALAYQKTHNPIKFWLSSLNNCNSSYRSWVHFREAIAAGCQFATGGRGPWRLNPSDPTHTLIEPVNPDSQQNKPTQQLDPISAYFKWGFWPHPEFLPGMYFTIQKEDPTVNAASKKAPEPILVNTCRFRGLIATHRVCKIDRNSRRNGIRASTQTFSLADGTKPAAERWITFVTLGIADGMYVDVVLYGAIRLGKCHVIEGEGLWMDNKPENAICPWVRVKSWKSRYLAMDYD